LQAEFSREIFALCKDMGINTCLDTSGSILNKKVQELLEVTDRVLLDIKYTSAEQYKKHVGCELERVMEFLEYLNCQKIPTVIRQVIIPGLNDNKENLKRLWEIKKSHKCVEEIELLPFRKMCSSKYENLSIPFPFENFPEPRAEKMEKFKEFLKKL
jgi:pyruvate formate lyase activating enzyme